MKKKGKNAFMLMIAGLKKDDKKQDWEIKPIEKNKKDMKASSSKKSKKKSM